MVAMDRLLAEERRTERTRRQKERRERAEARRSERIAVREFRDRIAEADSAVAEFHLRTRRLADSILKLWGFHRHARGQWRRRRVMSTDLSKLNPTELSRLVSRAMSAPWRRYSTAFNAELYGTVRRRDLEPGRDRGGARREHRRRVPPAQKEALIADAALIRLDLAPPGSSPAEGLMAGRASVSWLEVRLLEFDRADMLQQQEVPYHKLETLDRMLSWPRPGWSGRSWRWASSSGSSCRS